MSAATVPQQPLRHCAEPAAAKLKKKRSAKQIQASHGRACSLMDGRPATTGRSEWRLCAHHRALLAAIAADARGAR